MASDDVPESAFPHDVAESGRLESWKEIATYLRREVRTVQRWERDEGLPVHRLQHKKQGTVYAYKQELDAWTAQHQPAQRSNGRIRAFAWRGLRWWLAGTALVASSLVAYFSLRPIDASAPKIMMAVLPFENLGGNPDDYFADGVTDEMIAQLAALQPDRLAVIARTSAMQYKGKNKPVSEIGKELGVDYLLEGSVRRENDRVRITAQLIRVDSQAHLWAHSYDRDWADILTVQSEVAQQVARAIRITLTDRKESHPIRTRRIHPEAYDAYQRGRYEFNRWSQEGYRAAVQHFEEAAQKDTGYALAHAWLAHSYNALAFFGYMPPKQASLRARDAALKAVTIDPAEPEAHLALALIHHYQDWDWNAAQAEFRQALQLNPNSPMAHWGYAWFLMSTAREEDAFAEIRRALELDPFSPFMNTSFGDLLVFAHRYEDAVRQYEKTLQRVPSLSWTYELIGRVHAHQGRYQEAWNAHQKYRSLQGVADARKNTLPAQIPAVLNRATYWGSILQSLQEEERQSGIPPAMGFARSYADLGEKDAAFQWLEKAYEQRIGALVHLRVNPAWDPLRDDPRFVDLLRRVGLPP